MNSEYIQRYNHNIMITIPANEPYIMEKLEKCWIYNITNLEITNHATEQKAAPGIWDLILFPRFKCSSFPLGKPNPPGNTTYIIKINV